ncbi:hypothetical protein NP493_244g00013 [Ridgeia piscesae]|uniref:Uncharacterized protein n=1 Tax=Ridgeia piscesae TaxID=27915 RepID=A0AAD9UD77_RIDPI|nr:hypothetical protein NP493_244g00013 [Ridgeia piscesae]
MRFGYLTECRGRRVCPCRAPGPAPAVVRRPRDAATTTAKAETTTNQQRKPATVHSTIGSNTQPVTAGNHRLDTSRKLRRACAQYHAVQRWYFGRTVRSPDTHSPSHVSTECCTEMVESVTKTN